MDVDNVQTILENYKSTIQDEDSSSEHKEEDYQHIQNIVQQTLDNILTKEQCTMLKQGKCFTCNKPGHFSKNCPSKGKFKAIPCNKSYCNEKNRFTKKNYKKKEIAENQNTEPESSEEEDVLTTDNEQDFQNCN